jgi:hypothetical protein
MAASSADRRTVFVNEGTATPRVAAGRSPTAIRLAVLRRSLFSRPPRYNPRPIARTSLSVSHPAYR